MTKKEMRDAIKKIHQLVNGRPALETFQVLERIDKISMRVLTEKTKHTGANR